MATDSWRNNLSVYLEGLRETRKFSKKPVSRKELETKIPENVRSKPANPRPRHSAYIKRNFYDAF
jgi:hypothetical protein